jgi:hypothetical protein
MARYEKYIWCEFGYTYKNGTHYSLLYTGTEKGQGFECAHCGKKLFGKLSYLFTQDGNGPEWVFGSECVKNVFGAGLVTLKESQKERNQ